MARRYDIVSGRTDANGKTYWTKLGSMWPAKEGDGFSIKLEALPLPDKEGNVWIRAFVPKEREGEPAAPRRAPTVTSGRDVGSGFGRAAPDDRDIPF